MPQINRIRVNNVRYNFGTQFYDDFIMRFSGKNTIYDLANGGGKSVLMLLLLQNMIPNCTLDDKQPIEKLFRTGSGSNTIHSLVEWNLSDVHIKNNYKYMLTGFCARKGREEEKDQNTAAVEYFNYVIFYREYNDNDIKNLPLSVTGADGKKERITYLGLKNYLRDLEKKDFSLEVKIFDRKGDYQRFISEYGIYESEWEIIRGINKTEGHVRTYFESNYKTTRKVVENLLIEEIIEKAFHNRVPGEISGQENQMAETLLEIRNQLLELSARKNDIHNYDRQMELLQEFVTKVSGMKEVYFDREALEKELASGYCSVKGRLKAGEEEKVRLEKRIQELENHKAEEKRAAETVRVQESEEKVKQEQEKLEQLGADEEKQEKQISDMQKDLTLAESVNDYLDYLYYRKERDIVRETLAVLTEDKGELLKELENMAAERRKREAKLSQELQERLEGYEARTKETADFIADLKLQRDRLARELAVAEYKKDDAEQKIKKYNQRAAEFRQELEAPMLYDPQKELELCDGQIKECEAVLEENSQKLDGLAVQKQSGSLKTGELQWKLEAAGTQMEEYRKEEQEMHEYEMHFQKLQEVYQETGTDRLIQIISGKLGEKQKQESQLQETLKRKNEYYTHLADGMPVGISAEAEKVLQYINRYHDGAAVAGTDLLKEFSTEQRKEVLKNIPVLPYCIVVKKEFENIIMDTGISELNLGDYAVPVIAEEELDMDLPSGTFYAMYGKELFYNEKKIREEAAGISHELEKLQEEAMRMADEIRVYQKDLEFLKDYVEKYSPQIQALKTKIQLAEQDIHCYEVSLQQENEAAERRKQQEEHLRQEQEILAEKLGALSQKQQRIAQISECQKILKETEEELEWNGQEKKQNEKEYSNILGRLEAWQAKEAADQDAMAHIRDQMAQMAAEWEKYRSYYKADVQTTGYEELSLEELENRFMGTMQALQGGNSEYTDKQRLLENYETAMEKSLQAVDYKGISVKLLEERQEKGLNYETSKEELIRRKNVISDKSSELKKIKELVRRIRSEKDRLEGAVQHGRDAIVQKYGVFEPVNLQQMMVVDFLEEKQKNIKILEEQVRESREQIKETEQKAQKFSILLHDMERVVSGKIQEETTELLPDTVNLEECVGQALKKYDQYQKKMQKNREDYEQAKTILAGELRKNGSAGLADEVLLHLGMPGSMDEVQEQTGAVEETIACLKLEKNRIEKNIQDMEQIKQNFESQCIQSCMNIKAELEKLPKLSRIKMDEEVIPMISLQIPYVREEEYDAKMSEYINQTVEQADRMASEEERVRYIRGRLSWKQLFSVIVTDMNEIRLNLYKRERIREQSRYLRYEEAVGSTGQSQGIYIQFLIAIINYISSIYSRNTDSIALKKVIFIDNPFGAAKDIYIWEPIFKMLKTNNVQLIVPCRGATPAITGRFDVNYVLGQKLVNGRQQTVVVDYYSSVDSEKLDYTTMTYEQGVLDLVMGNNAEFGESI